MMKKTILHIATAVMLLAIFTACEKEALQAAFEGNNGKSIRILLNAQGDDVTRAVSRNDGNDAYGEDTIATADVFFYNADGTLIYNVAKENVTLSEPDANGVVTATVPMPSSDENIDLTQATKVYVMGNRQATDAQVASAKTSEAGLRALTFTTTSLDQVPTAETTFAMDGTGEITVAGNEISGTVELVRAAAKITLEVNLPSTLTADDKTYKPQTTGITVTFNKGVKTFGDETDMFNVEQRDGIAGTADAEGNTPVSFEPFYSYPTTWETGDDNEPYFTLHVPWGETNSEGSVTSYTTYHYRVPINKTNFDKDENGTNLTTLSLKRNHWYQINLTVGVLGTPEASDYVEVPGNYEVKPWGNLPIGADLLDFKYLVVDKEQVEIYNQNSASVAFASSHPVTLEILSIKKWDYSTEDERELTYVPNTTDKTVVPADKNQTSINNFTRKLLTQCKVDAVTGDNPNKGNIVLNHVLINEDASENQDADGNNKTRDDYDYVYYTITVKVTNGYYTENITFIQYPEMYIKADKNEGGNIVYDFNTDNDDKGYVFVYNNQYFSGSNWQVVRSCKDGGNNNPNMYVITVTALDNSDIYIGDPRVTTPVKGSSLEIGDSFNNKTLTNYFPTRVDNEDIIAPQFRMASSYGKCGSTIDHEEAKRRCAAYQEYGYPAGRWRLPTVAEFEYVQQLSDHGIIPQLYTSGSNYWTATTAYKYGDEPSNSTTAYVRCVYDDWFWGDGKLENKGVYTWGDQPK